MAKTAGEVLAFYKAIRRRYPDHLRVYLVNDNLSLHWFTGAGAASIRLYRESALDPGVSGRVEVPTAILMPLRDGVTVPAPREWAERSFNVTRWTIMERGGHFPEWEVPQVVADDLRRFVAELLMRT